jgi:hypothetical protein
MTIWVAFGRPARPGLEQACAGDPDAVGSARGGGLDGFRHAAKRPTRCGSRAWAGRRESRAAGRRAARRLCADGRERECARRLGPLAGDDDVATRLRETVRVYLAAGESQVATAQRCSSTRRPSNTV